MKKILFPFRDQKQGKGERNQQKGWQRDCRRVPLLKFASLLLSVYRCTIVFHSLFFTLLTLYTDEHCFPLTNGHILFFGLFLCVFIFFYRLSNAHPNFVVAVGVDERGVVAGPVCVYDCMYMCV